MQEISKPTQGKRILITGATSGIGLATARELARQGAEVIIVSSSRDNCAAAVKQIKQQTGNNEVKFFVADLSSQQSIRQLVNDFKKQYQHLDVLVNNVGLVFMKRQESVDGIELTLALNHLGFFLLTSLLLETLIVSGRTRIVNVSSAGHLNGKINFEDIEGKKHYNGVTAYDQSKLANIMFTYELSRRLQNTSVTANCLHPGLVATNFGANNGGFYRYVLRPLLNPFSASPEKGAETSIYLATNAEVAGVTGKYFGKKQSIASSKSSYDEETWKRLWEVSEEFTRLDQDAPAIHVVQE
ncbi:MAG: SDR family oxidoreductase [Ktedonobacteraceae bacterium]